MPEEQNPAEIADLIERFSKQFSPEQMAALAPALAAAIAVVRSNDYKSIYSNLYRARMGYAELTLVLSRITHTPSVTAQGNLVEEVAEIIMGWPQIKMLSRTLSELVQVFEEEVGTISIPTAFQSNLEGHRQALRSLGLPAANANRVAPASTVPAGAPAGRRARRKS